MINNILKKIEKANEVQKVELEKHEVELGIVDDLKAQFNKYFSVYNADLLELEIVDAVKKLNTNYTASAKEFSNFDKIYNEYVGQRFFKFSYSVTYKTLDRGLFEILGPTGISVIVLGISK